MEEKGRKKINRSLATPGDVRWRVCAMVGGAMAALATDVGLGLARPLIVRAVLRRPKGARFRRVVNPHEGEAHLERHRLRRQFVDNLALVAGSAGAQLVVQGAAATHGLWRAAEAWRQGWGRAVQDGRGREENRLGTRRGRAGVGQARVQPPLVHLAF